jgi:hypothetical protein
MPHAIRYASRVALVRRRGGTVRAGLGITTPDGTVLHGGTDPHAETVRFSGAACKFPGPDFRLFRPGSQAGRLA